MSDPIDRVLLGLFDPSQDLFQTIGRKLLEVLLDERMDIDIDVLALRTQGLPIRVIDHEQLFEQAIRIGERPTVRLGPQSLETMLRVF